MSCVQYWPVSQCVYLQIFLFKKMNRFIYRLLNFIIMEKLTLNQLQIFDSFIKFLDSYTLSMFILSGGAGVGKTFLTIKMIQYCFSRYSSDEIIDTPPVCTGSNCA